MNPANNELSSEARLTLTEISYARTTDGAPSVISVVQGIPEHYVPFVVIAVIAKRETRLSVYGALEVWFSERYGQESLLEEIFGPVGHLMNHKTRARALWEAFENTLGESA